ncbi:MAG: hypothetical protein R6V08_07765 [Desulfuromonadales bacterium]
MRLNSGSCIAIPYYGFLMRPGKGFERIYFLADPEEGASRKDKTRMDVWNPNSCTEFDNWLVERGVGQVVCIDCPPSVRRQLESSGIDVHCHLDGENLKGWTTVWQSLGLDAESLFFNEGVEVKK